MQFFHQKNILERQTQGGEDAGGDDNMPEKNAAQLMRDGNGSDDGVGVGVNRSGLSEIGSVFDGDDGSDDWLAAAAVAEVAQEKVTRAEADAIMARFRELDVSATGFLSHDDLGHDDVDDDAGAGDVG